VSGLGACRDCGEWIYWGEVDGRNVPFDSDQVTYHWQTCAAQDFVEVDGGAYRVTRCKDCKRAVYWETTWRGRKRPMDVFVDEDTGEYSAAPDCHFDTCTGKDGASRSYQSYEHWKANQKKAEHKQQHKATSNGRQTDVPYSVRLLLPDLQLTWPCTRADVVSSFRKLALETHPDMGGQAKEFIKVKRAYDALKDLVPA
jgi:hypothetical protein